MAYGSDAYEFFENLKKEIPKDIKFSTRNESVEALMAIGSIAAEAGFERKNNQSERYEEVKPILNKVGNYPPIPEKWALLVEIAKYVYFDL